MNPRDYVKPWVVDLEKYVAGEFREGFIKLASNENNWGPSPKVVEAIKSNAGRVYVYPYLGGEVRKKVASYVGVPPECVLVGNGSDELMELVLKTFRDPVAGFNPSYASYRLFSRALGMDYVGVNLNEDFGFFVEDFIKKAGGCNVWFVGSPNNPTGSVMAEDDVVRLLDVGKIVVVDEAYYEFYGKTVVGLTKEYPNLIVLRTLSKAFGIGGLRVGYAVGDPETISLVNKVKPPFSVTSISEVAALAALDDLGYMRECVGKIVRDRGMLFEKLSAKFRVCPSEANFLLVDVSPMTAEEFFKKMLDKKIIVRKLGRFDGFRGEYVRVTVGTSGENRKLVEAVKSV